MPNLQEDAPLASEKEAGIKAEKNKEWRLFIFIIVFLFPLLTIAIVGAMGFSIWFYQLIMGPPGPY